MKTKKQVLVNRKGDIYLGERPAPELTPVSVLVETKFSMISPGTEISVMKGFIGAADDDEVIGLGYSASGVVAEVGSEVSGLKVGDRIGSYGGPYTTHSSILGVPQTLCAKIPENVSLEEAAFCGLGAIAMHGVRKGGVMLGDNVVVVGLGPIGQLASQIATAAGGHVIAIDLSEDRLKMAASLGAEKTIQAGKEGWLEKVDEATDGIGADVVLICASGKYPKFMEEAIRMVRKQGQIVVVGLFPIEVPRDPFFYKEPKITISRAAGPGRYNPVYERDAHDYPPYYVRWTEGRNIAEVLRLISLGRLNVKPLINITVSADRASEAYDAIEKNPGAIFGALLAY